MIGLGVVHLEHVNLLFREVERHAQVGEAQRLRRAVDAPLRADSPGGPGRHRQVEAGRRQLRAIPRR